MNDQVLYLDQIIPDYLDKPNIEDPSTETPASAKSEESDQDISVKRQIESDAGNTLLTGQWSTIENNSKCNLLHQIWTHPFDI